MTARADASDVEARLVALARLRLASLPSPLTAAPRLGAAFGIPELWVKRDELLGFGFGGNKVRALELFLADALAKGADTLVTGAGPQSNHVRVTAAAAAHAGLACEAFSWGPEPTSTAQGNLLLSRMLGARVHFTGDADRASVDRGIEAAMTRLRAAGRTPYAIPRGGASALGVLAHVLAVQEALAQTAARGVRPAAVVMAVGSGCTLAGWLLGRRLFGTSFLLEGIVVSRPARETRVRVVTLAAEAATLLGGDAAARLARTPFVDDELGLHDGFLGEGYGIPTIAGLAALRTAARCEGIFTDPTYTGKALAGLAALAHDKRLPTGPVLFLHTGGEPALFAHAEAIVHAEGA